ncbi:sulfate transporter-like protein [Leishmania mexicana MHOM/GT/2001/U1103]|uniref:Sulfate transporter-like protein n=1 Tax=Leishmania mexicana (strain MHOM/GT/2001/U1103) TaxID=929439 RepID=E9AZY8_LEIMU|nr:sulfate transporter-like protein [Leishmania mexicana MHOM/GT/2001/U1103]CBZ28539.1 sulfate transporter-like protein [Leishmania mexicana MHOM/GT/2001/U1103]
MKYVYRFVPVSRWYRLLTPKIILSDGIAGFIVGVMIVPTCLSWSSLAGLPFSCGLIAALVASFSYGTFGQCASLSIGPVAEITTLLISIPGIPVAERKDTFQSLGVQVGILSMVLSFVDCGTVIKTIFAKAVGDGYTCAAALLAISAQLKVMFNVVPEDKGYGNFINTLITLASQMSAKNVYCFMIFMVYCTYLIQIKKAGLPLWIPHQLIVVVASTFVTWGLRLDQVLDLAIVRDIPAVLSWPRFPPMNNLIGLGPYTLTITVIIFVQMYVVAQRVMPNIDPNTELFAGGITNLLVNLMSGMPVSNSFSCSSVLIEQKVHTPLTAYATGAVVLITILFLTRLGVFYYLPKQALAAIVVSSVWRLVNFSGPAQLWHYSRKDAGVWVLTFLLTLIGGITIGVLSGIAFSLILVVLRIARPRAVSVGFNMQTFRYGDIRKDPELLVYPNILMWRFDAPLYFINIGYFQERLIAAIAAEVRPIDVVIVTCGKVVDIDAAALASLPFILDYTAKSDPTRPRRIILTDIHGRLEKVLLASAALPIYVPEEYDRISIEQITASGKFPVVFRRLEEAIAFGQRCISERYGNVDTAPYPNVSFLTDVVMETARLPTGDGCVPSFLSLLEAENASPTVAGGTAAAAAAPLTPNTPQIVVTSPDETSPRPSRAEGGRGKAARTEASIFSSQLPHNSPTTSVDLSGPNVDDDGDDGDDEDPPQQQQQDSLVRHLATLKKLSTYSPDRELVGVLGVIRHGEVTPKQKKKLLFNDPTLLQLAFQGRDVRRTKRSVDELTEFFAVVERLLLETPASNMSSPGSADMLDASFLGTTSPFTGRISASTAESWARVLSIVRSHPDGLKIQVKARMTSTSGTVSFTESERTSPQRYVHYGGSARWKVGGSVPSRHSSGSGSADDDSGEPTVGLLVVKWGGVLTKSGILQAHVMGEKLFARFYAAGDLPLRRLVQFTRHPLVTASDENRVVNTALVVANALTQTSGATLHRCDIVLNDGLTKTLGPVAKRLLQEEYRCFESLLHIESAAAARHFFHIPGFRQLLSIPPRDRLGLWVGSEHDDSDGSDNGATHMFSQTVSKNSENDRAPGLHGCPPPSSCRSRKRTACEGDPRSTQFNGAQDVTHGSRAFSILEQQQQQQQQQSYNCRRQDEFYTPYQVLQELEELMTILSTLEFPVYLAKVPLSNYETLQELQRRYEAMLKNFKGAKRRIRSGYKHSVHMMSSGDPKIPASPGARTLRPAEPSGFDEDTEQQMLLEAMEETGGSSDEDGFDAQLVGDTELDPDLPPRRDPSAAGGTLATAGPSHLTMPALSGGRAGEPQHGRGNHSRCPAPAQQRTRNGSGNGGHTQPRLLHTGSGPFHPLSGHDCGRGHYSRGLPGAAPCFDVSDVSKLRDYGSYDVTYNLPLVLQLHASMQEPVAAFQLRRFARALQRFSEITEYLSRIGENVLVGINSSKRFIIGSLVSDGLLRRLHNDFQDLAMTDEERGVQELLLKAQAQYMAENGGVEQDVRHMIGLCSRLPCWRKKKRRADEHGGSAWRNDVWARETPQEREFRLRVPFISLPKQEACTRAAAADFEGCTRLYFTSYLHVEGVLQCLFESATVEGFSRPSKEEMEATHQLYMRHLIFKIFRRRNVSYTDAEVATAMRRLHLLFRSDVDYDQQQRELRLGLAAIYHAMYYVSMEVYLSLGDADEAHAAILEDFPLFNLGRAGDGDEDGDTPSAADTAANTAAGGGDSEEGEELVETMAAAGAPSAAGGGMGRTAAVPSSPLMLSFAPSGGTSCVSSDPASYLTAAGGRNAAAFSAASGGRSAEGFAVFARSPSHVQHLVPVPNDPDATATLVADGAGSARLATSPLSLSDAPERAVAGSGVESDSGEDKARSHVHRRVTNMSTLALAPPPQREPKLRSRSMTAVPANTQDLAKEATVLMTPEAGRRTAMVQEMKHRVSNVTPMRRIHEGLNLNDFVLLMKEVESAVRSQTASSSSPH